MDSAYLRGWEQKVGHPFLVQQQNDKHKLYQLDSHYSHQPLSPLHSTWASLLPTIDIHSLLLCSLTSIGISWIHIYPSPIAVLHSQMGSPLFQVSSVLDNLPIHTAYPNHCCRQKQPTGFPSSWHISQCTQKSGQSISLKLQASEA